MKKINDLQLNHQLSLNNYKQMIDKQVKTQIYQNNSQF